MMFSILVSNCSLWEHSHSEVQTTLGFKANMLVLQIGNYMYRKFMNNKVCNEEEQHNRCFEILIMCSNWEVLG